MFTSRTIKGLSVSDNQELQRSSDNILPVDIMTIKNEPENTPQVIQNFIVKHLDDNNIELILCDIQDIEHANKSTLSQNINLQLQECATEETHAVYNNQDSILDIDLNNSETVVEKSVQVPVIRINPQDPASEHSLPPVLKSLGLQNVSVIEETNSENITLDITVYSCFKCNDQFRSLNSFRQHLKWHNAEKSFTCPKCSAGFNVENNLKIHMVTSHPGNSDICPICKIKFQRKASLKSHILLHQVEELLLCEECHAEFQNEDELLKHVEGHAVEKVNKTLLDSLICPYCRLNFTNLSDFRQHIAKHVEIKRTVSMGKKVRRRKFKKKVKGGCKCKYCGKIFPKTSLLERHERIHTGEKPYKCQFCPRAFVQKCTLQIHLDKHTGLRPYPCTLCPAKFTQKGNLWAHVEKTHTAPQDGHKMYKCTQCSCIFRKIASLNGHITKMHLNQPEDSSDSKNLIDKVMHSLRELHSELGKSVLKRNESKPVEEPLPVETGTSVVKLAESDASGGVRRYIVRQTKIGDVRWYFCNFCSSRFKKPSDLIRHFRTHTREKPFKCSKCNQAFSLKSTLITHYKVHEKLGSECNYCDTSFRNSRQFNAHVRDHDSKGAANFICVLCQEVFFTMAEGKEHRAQHDGEIQSTQNIIEPLLKQPLFQTTYGSLPLKYPKAKVPNTGTESHLERPHHCKICDARFARLKSLKKHMLYHNGERKFKCNLCPKSFITNYGLKNHMNYHLNIKNYACDICDKKFVNSSLLKRHLIVHNSIRPYLCPYCDKKFKTALLCRWHIKNVHKLTSAEVEKLKIEKTLEGLEKQPTVNQSPMELLKNRPVSPESRLEPAASDNNKNDPPLSLEPPQENGVLLNVTSQISEPQRDLQPEYQMVYLNLSELPVNSDTLVSPPVKLTNDSYFFNSLSDLTESSVLFNIETGKADMVDPNEVIRYNIATTTTSEATSTNLNDSMEPKQESILVDVSGFTTSEEPQISVQNFPTVDLGGVPVSMIEASESSALSTTIINGEIIPHDAPVICINCHKLFSDYCWFEKHTCSEESSAQEQDDLNLLIRNADAVQNKSDERIYDAMESNNERVLCASGDPPSIQIDNASNILGSDSYENRDLVATSASNANLDLENMKRFSYKKPLLIDVEKLEQPNEYRCKNCNFVTALEDKYRRHLYFHTDLSDRICKFCFKEFKKPSDMRRHFRTHTGEKPFECQQCHKKFSLKSTLKSHMRTHDVPGTSRIACDVCNSNFTSESSLKVHMLLHTGARPHACTFCDQTFRTSAIRKAHEKNIHLSKNEHSQTNTSKVGGAKLVKSIAEEVAEKIRKETRYNNDTIVPESLEPMEASIVVNPEQPESISLDSVYLLQQIQNSGIILNSGIDDGSIPIDITLLDVGNLQLGDWKQQAESPQSARELNTRNRKNMTKGTVQTAKQSKMQKVECDICHKWYTSKNVLRKHKKALHGQNRKFPCIKCDKGYDNLEELNKHIVKLHTGSRPYACQYCANSFSEETSLKTHIKRIHQKSLAGQEATNALIGLQYDLLSKTTFCDLVE